METRSNVVRDASQLGKLMETTVLLLLEGLVDVFCQFKVLHVLVDGTVRRMDRYAKNCVLKKTRQKY